RRFRGAPVSSPEIELPRDRSLYLQGSDVLRRKAECDRRTFSEDVDSGARGRKLIGPRDAQLCLGLENPSRGKLEVAVLTQGCPNERLERRVGKDLPPRLVSKRRIARWRRLRPERARHVDRRTPVVRPDEAAGRRHRDTDDQDRWYTAH